MSRSITSILRLTVAIFAACTLMVSLGCGDVKPDADATGDSKTKTPAKSDREAATGGATEAK